MSNGPRPEDFRAKVFRDREHTRDWRIEKLEEDGEQVWSRCSAAATRGSVQFGTLTGNTAHSMRSS